MKILFKCKHKKLTPGHKKMTLGRKTVTSGHEKVTPGHKKVTPRAQKGAPGVAGLIPSENKGGRVGASGFSVSSLRKKPFFGPICVGYFFGLLFDAIYFYITQSSFIRLNIFFYLTLIQLLSDGALQNILVTRHFLTTKALQNHSSRIKLYRKFERYHHNSM